MVESGGTSWNSTTKAGWLGSYDNSSSGGGSPARPVNYTGSALQGWMLNSAVNVAGVVSFFVRPDNFSDSTLAAANVIQQLSSQSSLFSVTGTSTLPNYNGSTTYSSGTPGTTT